MLKIKGMKIIKTKGGNPRQLVIDIHKHYEIVEDLLEKEKSINEL